MSQNPIPIAKCSSRGFSLVELAMVLLIVGLLLGGLITAIGESTYSVRRTSTESALRQIEEAIYGFAQANGRLPCPATDVSAGLEAVDAPVADGVCTEDHGMVPTVTLGLFGNVNNEGLLLDPWGNPYRYSVSAAVSAGSGSRAFTSVTGLREFFNDNDLLNAAPVANLLEVCDDETCTGTTLSNNAPAVVLSMGENWATSTSAWETENAEIDLGASNYPVGNDISFVDREYNEDNYDDQILWLSPHILFTRLIQAGRLP